MAGRSVYSPDTSSQNLQPVSRTLRDGARLMAAVNGHGTQRYQQTEVRPTPYGQATNGYLPDTRPAQRTDTYVAVPLMDHSGMYHYLVS